MAEVIKYSETLTYELTDTRYMGSKTHARAALKGYNQEGTAPEEFVRALVDLFPEDFKNVEWLRFHVRDRIVVLFILPSPLSRYQLHNNVHKILNLTGWFPVIMGDRADFNMVLPHNKLTESIIKNIGYLLGFSVVHNSDTSGVSFELEGSMGSYVFDFGYHGLAPNNAIAIFLSHIHADHAGGILDTLKNRRSNIPVICSKSAASFIKTMLVSKNIDFEKSDVFYVDNESEIKLDGGTTISFFKVFHSPESIGFCVKDNQESAFFYFGDLCLRNGYADFFPSITEILNRLKGQRNILLLDAAMVGRNLAIEKDDTPDSILTEFAANAERRNIFIVGNQPENLIYSYLSVYKITHDISNLRNTKILVSPRLIDALKLILEPVVKNKKEFKDVVYDNLYGESKINPVETHRLYPLTEKVFSEINTNERLIIFASDKEIQKYKFIKSRLEKADVILTGTFALRDELPQVLSTSKPRTILRVSSENWGFHSSESDLKTFLEQLDFSNLRVYLFHNYKDRIDNFIKKLKVKGNPVQALPNFPKSFRF